MAPALLGAGPAALADAGVGTIADIARLRVDEVRRVGADVLLDARPEGAVDPALLLGGTDPAPHAPGAGDGRTRQEGAG